MSQSQLGILIEAAIDSVNSKAKLNAQIKQLQVNALKIGVQLDTASAKHAIKQLQAQQDSFYKRNLNGIDAEIKRRTEASQIFSQQIKSQMQAAVQAENTIALARKNAVINDTFATNIKKSQQDLVNLKDTFSSIKSNSSLSAQWQELFDLSKIVKSKEELQNLNAKIVLFKKEIGASNTLLDQATIKALKMIAVMKAFQLSVVAIKSMVNEVVALDTSLTELQKVVDLSGNQLENFTGRAFKAAEQVGRTGREMIDATVQFKKAGYDLENSLNLAKATLIMTNIGDGIRDVGEASSSLIAVLKGFNIDDSNVMSVLDSINAVANNSPIAFEDISQGLQRVSGTLAQTGTDINETIGLLTGGFSQLRNIEKVSTGLITISQRLRGVGEDGEAIDGLSASLQKEFGSVGIAIEDANGELRSTYDILKDYAAIYDTLSSKQQQFLSELAAGKRQVPVINAIVQQWGDVEKAIDQSTNSLGSAERENAIFMQSIQGKINILKSTFQEFATDTIDSTLIKSLVDLGTISLKTVDSLGGLQNILILITGLLVAKNWNSLSSIFTGIVGKVKDIPTAFRTAKQESAGLSGALNLLGVSASTAQIAIGALTAVITIGIAAYSHFRQVEEDARQAALAAADEANQQTIAIAELTNKYLKLADAVDLDGDSKKELLSLQQQLLKNFDLEGESIEDLTKKYGSLTEAIKAKTLESLQAEQIDLIGGLGAAEKNLIDANSSGFFGGNNILNAVGNDVIEAFKALEKAGIINSGSYGSGGGALVLTGDESTVAGALENYNRLGDALEVLRSQMGSTELQNNSLYNAMFKRYKELEPSVKGYNDLIAQTNNNLANQVVISSLQGQELPKTKAEFDSLSGSIIKSAQANGQFVGSATDIENSVMGVLATMPQFNQYFAESANQISDLSALSFEEVNKQIDSLQSAYQTLTTIVSDYNSNQYMTIDNLQSIIALGNDYLQYLTMENGQLKLNQDGMLALANARIDDAEATYLQESTALMKKFSDDKIAADYLKDSLHGLAGARLAEAEAAYQQAMADAMASGGDMAAAAEKLNGVVEKGRGIFDATRNSLGSYSSAVMGAASATKSAANDIKQAMSKAQSAIQSLLSMTISMIKQQYNDQKKSIQNQLDALSKRYNEEKKYLANISKEKKKQYDADKKALQDELEGYRKKINAQIELLREKESERDYQSELSEKQKEISDLEADLAISSLDTSEEGIRKRLELEAQLAEKRKELEEFQHDRGVELQEDALNKELDKFEETINSKLDLLDLENKREEEMHQNRLDEIDEEYERKRERLEEQQKDIEEKVSNEAKIRAEAIKLIEDKNSGLYQKLLEWNRLYGDGLDSTVINGWNNAQSAMEQFNGAQLGVLGVLNDLALKMNDFETATQNAAKAMENLADATRSCLKNCSACTI